MLSGFLYFMAIVRHEFFQIYVVYGINTGKILLSALKAANNMLSCTKIEK